VIFWQKGIIVKIPTIDNIINAHKIITPYIHKTPINTSEIISSIAEAELFFKCENMQKVGAFKIRGATNAVMSLPENLAQKGVATHSSGNFAAALAQAAKWRGIKSYIVMPDNSTKVKIDAVRHYGGEITFCEPILEARESTLEKIVKDTGANFIHSYDHPDVIAGQGTCALEIFEEIKDINYLVVPVGGGGLISGNSIVSKAISPSTKVIAAEPKGADDAYRSFNSGELILSVKPNTIADGLLTSLSERTFKIISKNVDEIITVSEDEIVSSMRLIWERMKIIIEPSSAVPLAVVLQNREKFKSSRIAIILSGGNVDLGNLPWK
jgi:threonine dehydratase